MHSGGGELRRIELSECRGALDQGNLGRFTRASSSSACAQRGRARARFHPRVAGDFVGELVQLFRKCRG